VREPSQGTGAPTNAEGALPFGCDTASNVFLTLAPGLTMLLVFIHAWSVTNTSTYGGLPTAAEALNARTFFNYCTRRNRS
jgi:hypothetical protein